MISRISRSVMAACVFGFLGGNDGWGAGPRVTAEGERPADRRLEPLKDLDGYFPMTVPPTLEGWQDRSEELRQRVLVSLGLWPMPTRTPLKAVVHGRIEEDGYTVEKVYFEAMPGFYVTGSLYRPRHGSGKRPGVLSPHGHWTNGRFMDAGSVEADRELERGAEEDVEAARSPLQARCVHLARMGCVVFHYDMLGYADSVQISQGLAHGFRVQRPEMNAAADWGLFSPQAESHLQSVMGLQTWISIRALDFLEQLEDVDPTRLACTGASGGGTQTFLLSAVDPRLTATYPAVMVSTSMQGGCTCENASLLRVGTGNIELASLFVPKPMAVSSADDWTREMAVKGFPELQRVYGLYGVQDRVHLHRGEQFGHNFNLHSRRAMYRWFNKHLHLNLNAENVEQERSFRRLTAEEMTVWGAAHPAPPAADPAFERKLLRGWKENTEQLLASAQPVREWFQEMHGPAWDVVLAADLKGRGLPVWEIKNKREISDRLLEMSGWIRDGARGAALPVVFLYPKATKDRTVVWLSRDGKSGLYDSNGDPRPGVRALLDRGVTVVGVDLLYQGEFLMSGETFEKTPRVKNPRESAAYTFGYTPSVFVERAHDVETLIRFIRGNERVQTDVSIIALKGMGAVASAARWLSGDGVDRVAMDTGGMRLGAVTDLQDPNFVPGSARYGDVPALIGLSVPKPTWVAGENLESLKLAKRYCEEAGAADGLVVVPVDVKDAAALESAAVGWLIQGM